MDNRSSKQNNFFFFPKQTKVKLEYSFTIELNSNTADFLICGPSEEVENRFYHILQIVKNIHYYQVNGDIADHFPGNTSYRIGINLNSQQALTSILWYLFKTSGFSNVTNLINKIDNLFSPSGSKLLNAATEAQAKLNEQLPEYEPRPQRRSYKAH